MQFVEVKFEVKDDDKTDSTQVKNPSQDPSPQRNQIQIPEIFKKKERKDGEEQSDSRRQSIHALAQAKKVSTIRSNMIQNSSNTTTPSKLSSVNDVSQLSNFKKVSGNIEIWQKMVKDQPAPKKVDHNKFRQEKKRVDTKSPIVPYEVRSSSPTPFEVAKNTETQIQDDNPNQVPTLIQENATLEQVVQPQQVVTDPIQETSTNSFPHSDDLSETTDALTQQVEKEVEFILNDLPVHETEKTFEQITNELSSKNETNDSATHTSESISEPSSLSEVGSFLQDVIETKQVRVKTPPPLPELSPRTKERIAHGLSTQQERALVLFQRKIRARLYRKKLSKMCKERKNQLLEIIATERSFCASLEILVKTIKTLSKKKLLDNNQMNTIFSNIESIYPLNQSFLKNLEDRIEYNPQILSKITINKPRPPKPPPLELKPTKKKGLLKGAMTAFFGRSEVPEQGPTLENIPRFDVEALTDEFGKKYPYTLGLTIGEIFKIYGPYFKMYSVYLVNYVQGIETLKRLRSEKKDVAEFFLKFKSDVSISMGKDITSFLVEPIQRVPRYQLLLQNLLKLTPVDSYDYQNLVSSLSIINEVNQHLNEKKRLKDTQSALLKMSEKFQLNLYSVGHRNIVDSQMMKVSHNNGPWIECEVFFFSDILYIFSTRSNPEAPELKKAIHLVFCAVMDFAHQENKSEKIFELKFLVGNVLVAFETDAKGNTIKWRKNLTESIANERKLKGNPITEDEIKNIIVARPNIIKTFDEKKLILESNMSDYEKNVSQYETYQSKLVQVIKDAEELPRVIEKYEILVNFSQERLATTITEVDKLNDKVKENYNTLAQLLRNDENALREYFGETRPNNVMVSPREVKQYKFKEIKKESVPRQTVSEGNGDVAIEELEFKLNNQKSLFNAVLNEKTDEIEKLKSELEKIKAEKTKLLGVVVQRTKFYTAEIAEVNSKLFNAESEVTKLKSELSQYKPNK